MSTPLREDRAAIEVIRAYWTAIAESSGDAIVGKTLDGIITAWNKGAERLYGYTEEEVIGRPISLITPSDRQHEIVDICARLKRGERVHRFDTIRTRKDGSPVHVSLTVSAIKGTDGSIIGASTIARDVTTQKQVEKMKDEFMATVSHELRTPLSSIKIMVDNLKDCYLGNLNSQQQECIAIISNNVDRLTHMINNLLDLSKLESGIIDLHVRPFSLNDLIEDCLVTFKPIAQERVVTVTTDLADKTDTVVADPDLMREVVSNLLDNGIRFTKSKVTIKTIPSDKNVEIAVSDDGAGIQPKDMKRLFNKFEQVNRQNGGRGYKGTGLGLTICKQIVELHHGRIWADSTPSDGTTFHVEIPLRGEV